MLPPVKADEAKRIVACAMDFGIALVLYFLLRYLLGSFIACFAAAAFLLVRDSASIDIFDGVSPGKKMVGLKVVMNGDESCDHVASIKRNLTIASYFLLAPPLVIFFALIPLVDRQMGYVAAFLIACLAVGMELYEVMTDKKGLRLGDLLADTRVIEHAFESADHRPWAEPEPTPDPKAHEVA